MDLISPSKVARMGLGFSPAGSVYRKSSPGRCVLCGFEIRSGDLFAPFSMGKSFTDWNVIGCRESRIVCGDCQAILLHNDPCLSLHSVISKEGARNFFSVADIAPVLLDPPEPPFIAVKVDQQQQHIIWKAPVNWSKDQYRIMLGNNVLTIRRNRLCQAVEIAGRIGQWTTERHGRKNISFVRRFIPDKASMESGRLTDELMKDYPNREDVEFLLALTPGEIWGLGILLSGQSSKPKKEAEPVSDSAQLSS